MPSIKMAGKSKEDLVAIAQIAGLLTKSQAQRMTKAKLIDFLEQEDARADSATHEKVNPPAETKPEEPQSEPAAAQPDSAAKEPVEPAPTEQPAEPEKPAAPVRRRTPARKAKKAGGPDSQQLTLEQAVQAAPEPAQEPPKKRTASRRRKPAVKKELPEKPVEEVASAESMIPAAPEPASAPAPAPVAQTVPPAVEEASPEGSEAAIEKEEAAAQHLVSSHRSGHRPRPGQARSMTRIPRTPVHVKPVQPEDTAEETPEKAEPAPSAAESTSPEAQTAESDEPQAEKTEQPSDQPKKPAADATDVQGGVLEIMPDGYGFLRKDNYLQGNKDIYVPPQYIRRFGLRPGDFVTGPVRLQRENDRYQALLYIKDVNGMPPEKMIRRPHFDRLTPIYPDERFVLETTRNELSTRIIDLVAPIGKGQRGMIVSPPKAGKTILLQKIANAVSINNPDTKLIVLLIDERPEEVTDMQRSINGEVVYSTFDKTPENHTKVVELVLERAMRLVELKQDVMILLDSMTRLARAYNLTINPTGRTLSGGLDPGALYGPKRFFGAARNIENGGSLTIIATSLIETGSRMDEVIFEEFKGTGNMEVYLDRKLSEKRIFPAIDINKSGTRREELLMNSRELDAVWTIRKAFGQLDTSAVTEAIINLLLKTKNNEHFISSVNVSFNDKNVFEAMRGTRPGQTQGGNGNSERPGYGGGGSYNTTGYNSNYRRYGTASNDDD